jgi:hypothetical protein
MTDYIKNNSNRYRKSCNATKIQSYETGKDIKIYSIIECKLKQGCRDNEYNFQKKILNQQNLYSLMRLKPELFPIISLVKNINLSKEQQRVYSNMWYKQFGTSQALPVNDNWGGFNLVGSEVPYTN